MFEDVMVDLETLGTRPGSVILSIGAVFFHPVGGLGPEFYAVIDVASSCVAGLVGDASTIKWWSEQSEAAREVYSQAFNGYGVDLSVVLTQFGAWLDEHGTGEKAVKVWGNGAAFDNAILAEAYKRASVRLPWRFFNDRCFRTLKNLAVVNPGLEPKFEGVRHNALADAKHQARWAIAIMQQLVDRQAVPATSLVAMPESDRGPSEETSRQAQSATLAAQSDGSYEPAINQARQGMLKTWPTCKTCGSVLTASLTCPTGGVSHS